MKESVYLEHHEAVRAFALRLAGNEADADDLTSATFEALPRALERYQGRSSVRSYLFGICSNVWHRMRRKQHRQQRMVDHLSSTPAGDAEDPERAVVARQLADRLARALAELPEPQRVAFVLTSIEERTAAEVSRLCGVPEATIRTRIFHARRKLRDVLEAPRGRKSVPLALIATVLVTLSAAPALATSSLGHRMWGWIAAALGIEPATRPTPALSPKRHGATESDTNPEPSPDGPGASPAIAPPAELGPDQSVRSRPPPSAPRPVATSPLTPAPAPREPDPARGDAPGDGAPVGTTEPPDPETPPIPERWDGHSAVHDYARAHHLYFVEHRYSEALTSSEAFLKTYPEDSLRADVGLLRAWSLVRLQRFNEAREALRQVQREVPSDPDIRALLEALENPARR